MSATIGVPRALLYYKYYPLWDAFLKGLGADIVVSGATTKKTINAGTSLAENELCLPVKVFYGHLVELKDKADALFVPRVISVESNAYTCPKFLGLPDLTRSVDNSFPLVLDPTFNARLGRRQFYRALFEFGKFFTNKKHRILKAWMRGVSAQRSFQRKLESGLTPVEAIDGIDIQPISGNLKIGIAGHPYNIYDSHISLNLIKRLKEWGADVVTTEMLPPPVLDHEAERLPKRLFWSYEKEVVGSVFHWLRTGSVDGIIYVLSFACGPDSLIQVLLENEAKRESGLPLTSLVIDEHSGEAGMITRVEAFVDMLNWRRM